MICHHLEPYSVQIEQICSIMTKLRWALIALLVVTGCDPTGSTTQHLDTPPEQQSESQIPDLELPDYTVVDYTPERLALGDLDQISERSVLRILVHREERYFPRNNSEVMHEQELAADLAEFLNVKPEFVVVDSISEVLPALQRGAGDIAIANLTETPERVLDFHFSLPVGHTTERLIANVTDKHEFDLSKPLSLGVREGTTFEETANELKLKHPNLTIKLLPPTYDIDQVFDALVSGEFDLGIQDSNILDQIMDERTELVVGPAVSTKRATGWVTRKGNPALAEKVDEYIVENKLSENHFTIAFRDWNAIKQSKTLRVVTRNRPDSYFIWRGELMGFEYDYIKKFADDHKLRLEILVPETRSNLVSWIAEGRADVAVGFVTHFDEVERRGVRYTRSYHNTKAHVITRNGEAITDVKQLAGKTVHVHRLSKHYQALKKLQENGIDVIIETPVNSIETDELVRDVSEGRIDVTVLDGQQYQIERLIYKNIEKGVALDEEIKHAWLVNKDSPLLLDKLNGFLKKEHRGLFYNITYKKYFDTPKKIQRALPEVISFEHISPYDDIVKKHSQQHGFDWRLITSQMYQESKFDPKAKSWVGALGLLQVMPRTAKELGYKPKQMAKPEIGIAAGVKYMKWVSERFGSNIDIDQRAWFTLAAYNAGIGHVRDARTLARKLGKDPNIWFGETEEAMLLLSQKKYYKNARYGFVRGHEPVTYVRNIKRRFEAYVVATENVASTKAAQHFLALLSCNPIKQYCDNQDHDRLERISSKTPIFRSTAYDLWSQAGS